MRRLNFKDSDKVGYIATVEPRTGETFLGGKAVVEAAKKGAKSKEPTQSFYEVYMQKGTICF